jgi:hypothetical protein
MSWQSWKSVDLFYSGDLIVAFSDERGRCYVSMYHSDKATSRHKWIWNKYLDGTLVPPEKFDELLMATLRNNLIDEINLTNVFAVHAPNKFWGRDGARFEKWSVRRAMDKDFIPTISVGGGKYSQQELDEYRRIANLD